MRARSLPMNVTVCVPRHVEDSQTFGSTVVLYFSRSRHLWRQIYPLLFEAPAPTSRRFVKQCLELLKDGLLVDSASDDGFENLKCRKLRLRTAFSVKRKNGCVPHIVLYLHPPVQTQLEYTFEQRLIFYEHQLIQAQTMAGYLSTLGGGFFMCHHFSTAVTLAQQQQRMALIINDSSMYYKCLVNQAYNYIYAGKFKAARKVIRFVAQDVKRTRPLDQRVLLNMCASAWLFGKRVREMARVLREETVHSKTVDDFARIRVVHDESKTEDYIKPFHL